MAARAGVGKATIYRRWPNKEELLLAAFGSLKSPYPEPGGVCARDDLVAMLTVMCVDKADPRKARRYALLLGEGEKYPRLMARYKETVVEPRRDIMRAVIRRGIETGELRPDTDVEVALLALTGAVLAKEKSADSTLDGDFAARGDPPVTRFHEGFTVRADCEAFAVITASRSGSGFPQEGRGSRHRFVIGRRRSRPKFFWLIFGPGGYWRRLYSAASTIRTTRSTSAGSCPAAISSAVPMSFST